MEERALVPRVDISHISSRVMTHKFAIRETAFSNVQLIDRVSKVASLVSALEALDHTVADFGASLAGTDRLLLSHLELNTVSSKVVLSRLFRVDELTELPVRVMEDTLAVSANKQALSSVWTFENHEFIG
jgi:hypothetical protein